MGQDTRRDPRAKVLSMTVRYKSATLDEFIEHHSYDISRGGMFVKTPSPFPPGTLLKFEVKIAEERRVMQGVGRVVWKRESSAGGVPAGMGVKFIKIDDDSKGVIDRLVTTRGEGTPSAFERGDLDRQGSGRPSARPSSRPAAPVAAPKRPSEFKATVIGLGNLTPEREGPEEDGATFFPKDDSSVAAPPEDERTVMRQATEFLSDALVGAGGSLEEVNPTPAPKQSAPRPPRIEPPPSRSSTAPTTREAPLRKKGTPPVAPSAKRASLEPPAPPPPPAHARTARPADETAGDALAPARFSENPRESGRKSSSSVAQAPAALRSEGAGQKAMILLLGMALVGAVAVWFMGGRTPDAPLKAPAPARASPHAESEEPQFDDEADEPEAPHNPKPSVDPGPGATARPEADAGGAPAASAPSSASAQATKPPSSASPEVVTPPLSKRPARPPIPPRSPSEPTDTTPVPSTGAEPALPPRATPPALEPPVPPKPSAEPASPPEAPPAAQPSAEPPPPKTGPAADNPYG